VAARNATNGMTDPHAAASKELPYLNHHLVMEIGAQWRRVKARMADGPP
jgi:hypothetical protein